MESVIWGLRTLDPILLATPVLLNLILLLAFMQFDFVLLLTVRFFRGAFRIPESFRPLGPGERPTGLVIIPSLLRNLDELNAIKTTVESAATNEYPSDLFVVASVDGRTEFPELYASASGADTCRRSFACRSCPCIRSASTPSAASTASRVTSSCSGTRRTSRRSGRSRRVAACGSRSCSACVASWPCRCARCSTATCPSAASGSVGGRPPGRRAASRAGRRAGDRLRSCRGLDSRRNSRPGSRASGSRLQRSERWCWRAPRSMRSACVPLRRRTCARPLRRSVTSSPQRARAP